VLATRIDGVQILPRHQWPQRETLTAG